MLFQMCYGPEVKSVYNVIRRNPGLTIDDLCQRFQYHPAGSIVSLLQGVIVLLSDLDMIRVSDGYRVTVDEPWNPVKISYKIFDLRHHVADSALDYAFTHIYEDLFVLPDQLFVPNLHVAVNMKYEQLAIGEEKINAWKRMMEYFGLGYRLYSGFYAIPHLRLLTDIIGQVDHWDGPLHRFCEDVINPNLPCLTASRAVFSGTIFALTHLHRQGSIHLARQQDLPYPSYGEDKWNWVTITNTGVTQ